MAFTERLSAPATDDRHWIQTAYGGLNECIHIRGGSVLPNCVGYAWGRVYEITGKRPALSRNNAENWWSYTADGYARGSTPKVGAVMCWAKGKAGVSSDGAGHVMVVERVNADGSVLASGSDYSGRRFYTRTFQPGYYLGSAYTFQGFIYASGEVSKYIEMEPVARDTAKDQITITSQVVNGRIYPGTASRSWGFLKAGTYDLYLDPGVEEKDGYKWYCVNPDYNGIGDRVWVAYSSDWAELHFAGESDPDAPEPEEADKEENMTVILKIGPMSAGDLATVRTQAEALSLPVQEPGDGTLIAGPMSAGDRRALEAIAASLLLPVEVAKGQEEPEEDKTEESGCPDVAELKSRLDELTAENAALQVQLGELEEGKTQLLAEVGQQQNQIEQYEKTLLKIRELVGA